MHSKPTVLITGANGLLGQKLVAHLSKHKEYNVLATGRGKSRIPPGCREYQYVPMDICIAEQVTEVFKIHNPRSVIHCASMTDVDLCETNREGCYMQNVQAVYFLVDACEKNGSHMVHLSTDFIFDGKNGPYSEDDAPNPLNYYGQTKLLSEQVLQVSSIDWTIVRTALVYGITHAMTRSNIVLWVKSALENGKELTLVDDQTRTPTLAEDLAAACITILDRKALGVYNVSGMEILTPYQMGVQTAVYFGLDAARIKRADSSSFSQKAPRPLKTGFLLDKAVKLLYYSPRNFREGIEIMDSQLPDVLRQTHGRGQTDQGHHPS